MKKSIHTSGWGNFPRITKQTKPFILSNKKSEEDRQSVIPRGCGKSYGDSALANTMYDMRSHNEILNFDKQRGILHCQSGVLLSSIMQRCIPLGWLPAVMPGTKHITVGGAIASDVHGKNHQHEGCFSEALIELEIQDSLGNSQYCSSETNSKLFYSSCGGMGLTGIILSAKIQLKKISSQHIQHTTIHTHTLKETFDCFENYQNMEYSVSWIDCFAKGSKLGKGVFEMGEHASEGDLNYHSPKSLSFPYAFFSMALNRPCIRAFNTLYLLKTRKRLKKHTNQQKKTIDEFLFPLDKLKNWNEIYGKRGFVQYQFVLPLHASYEGISEVLKKIQQSQETPTLAVLKLMGEENRNLLSFPMKGYSLAVDFKMKDTTLDFLRSLDDIVIAKGGRFYLAKDARVSKATFEQGYPHIEAFRRYRKANGLYQYFSSHQSKRLSL